MDYLHMRGFADRCRQESKSKRTTRPTTSPSTCRRLPQHETFSVFVANVPFAVSEAQVRAVCAETGDLVDFDLPPVGAARRAARGLRHPYLRRRKRRSGPSRWTAATSTAGS